MAQSLRELIRRLVSGSLLMTGASAAAAASAEAAERSGPPVEPSSTHSVDHTGGPKQLVLREQRPRLVLQRATDATVELFSSHRSHRSHSSHRSHYSSAAPTRPPTTPRTPNPPSSATPAPRAPATAGALALGARALAVGMQGRDVDELMRYLLIFGVLPLDKLNTEARFTRDVEVAVRAFQRNQRLPEDGQVGPGTTLRLKASPCKVAQVSGTGAALGSRALQVGARGPDVDDLMRYLVIHGFLPIAQVNTTSTFTREVEAAVRAFQAVLSVEADGRLDETTALLLIRRQCS